MPSDAAPHAPQGERLIAAFDFDGTLTVRDSFTAFLRWRTTWRRWALGVLRLGPALLAYLFTRDRGRLKAAGVGVFLKGLSCAELAREAEGFCAQQADRLLRPDALRAWAAHRARGDRLMIVTASPEDIVAPFAKRLGADDLIGSRLMWSAEGRLTGELEGPNCRGPEKVARLYARFGPDMAIADAYGDTSGDLEMLSIARRAHMRAFSARA